MFHRKINYRWIAGKKTVTSCVNIRIKNRSKSNETINNLHNWINISLIINFWLKLGSFQTLNHWISRIKKFNWPVTSRFFTRHKRKEFFFWSVVSSVKVSVRNLLCKNRTHPKISSGFHLWFGLLIANTVENRWLKNTKILRFDQRNLFHEACSTLHRRTRKLEIQSFTIESKLSRRRFASYFQHLFKVWHDITKRLLKVKVAQFFVANSISRLSTLGILGIMIGMYWKFDSRWVTRTKLTNPWRSPLRERVRNSGSQKTLKFKS